MGPVIIAEYVFNGAMLGLMYALVAVGFSLFFGVLNVIQFSHGDVLTLGAFSGLVVYFGMLALGIDAPLVVLVAIVIGSCIVVGVVGAIIAQGFIIPMRDAPPVNVLLMTLMIGTAIREGIRLFYPNGANPKAFPTFLPTSSVDLGFAQFRLDSILIFIFGAAVIVGTSWLITRTRLGLAIRAVAQDSETAQILGINFRYVVLATFAFGSVLAGLAGIMHGSYYSEVNFGIGLLLGVIGFSSAILGGLGNIYGAIIGGFLFAALQTVWVVAFPSASGYKDVFAFAFIIVAMTLKPTGLIAERRSERV
jgi:branched-chain amino acid transport system permease protein